MRPGVLRWAENDTWVGAPDAGANTKAPPLAAHMNEGHKRERRPGPDIFNWMLNRFSLVQRFAAKLFCSNWTVLPTLAHGGANYNLLATCHVEDANNSDIFLYFWDSGGGGQVTEVRAPGGRGLNVTAASPVVAGILGVSTMDADGDDYGDGAVAPERMLVVQAVAAGRVYRATGYAGGAWALAVGMTAGKHWLSVGCDRNTAAVGSRRWLIGDSGAGGTIAPILNTALGAGNFGAVAGFPVLPIGNQISFIGHTNHPAGALGPDDTGNPSWLVLTTAPAGAGRSLVSADGATWSDQAHGFGAFTLTHKAAAYSRTSGRWVAPTTGGNIEYSNDNGANWTQLAGVLTGAGTPISIQCDGYGTFVVNDETGNIWVSVDEGLTWSRIAIDPTAGYDEIELEVGKRKDDKWSDSGAHGTFFSLFYYDKAAPLLEAWRSLLY